jgi:predicted MFS family arabinose efflux permease
VAWLTSVRRVRTDWRVAVGVVSGGHLLSHLYFLALPPLFPLLRSSLTLNSVELGLLLSAMSVGSLLQLPVGGIVDRVGPRWIFLAGLIITAAGMVLAGFAVSYPFLLAAVFLSGLGQAAFHPADYAILDVAVDSSIEGKSFSIHTFGGYLGSAAGPIVVGSIGLFLGWRTALIAVGLVGLVYAMFAWITLGTTDEGRQIDDQDQDQHNVLALITHPAILGMFGFLFVLNLGSKGIQAFTTILVVDVFKLGESLGNTTLTVFFAATAIGVLAGGSLADPYRPRRLIPVLLTVAGSVIGLVVSGLVPIEGISIAGYFGIAGFCLGIVLPARDRLISDLSPTGSTGKSFGFVFTGLTVAGRVGPPAFGGVIETTSLTVAFLIVAGCYLAAGLIILSFTKILTTAE